MDRSHYDSKLIDAFELIGCYFTNQFFNEVYKSAKRSAIKRSETITDEYKKKIRMYIYGITNKEDIYRDIIKDLLKYHQNFTRFQTLSLRDFESTFIHNFIPEDFYRDLSEKQKDKFLFDIITHIVSEFGRFVLQIDNIKIVIDKRREPNQTRRWVEQIIDIALLKREELHNQFLMKNVRTRDMVSVDVVKKIRDNNARLIEELKEKVKNQINLTAMVTKYKQIIEILAAENEELKRGASSHTKMSSTTKPPTNLMDDNNKTTVDDNDTKMDLFSFVTPTSMKGATRKKVVEEEETESSEPESEDLSEGDDEEDDEKNKKMKELRRKLKETRAAKNKQGSNPFKADLEDNLLEF